jgi:putative redox protein
MATVNTRYLGQLRTEATHNQSGNILITDAPLDNNGKGEAFSPTDTVAAALASCMMTIMGIIAERDQVDMTGLTASVTKIMTATLPRKIAEIQVDFNWANCPASDIQRTKLKKAALTCPVALSLHPEVKQTIQFDF